MKKPSKTFMNIILILVLSLGWNQLAFVNAADSNIYKAHTYGTDPLYINGIRFTIKQKTDNYLKHILSMKKNGSTTIIDQSSSVILLQMERHYFMRQLKKLGEEKTLNTIWRYDIKKRTKKKR